MHIESAINHIAARQGGVITRQQLYQLGVSEKQIERRLASGWWNPYARGAYSIFEERDPMDRVRAAVAVLPGAVVSHFSAAELHGIDRVPPGPATVLVHTTTTHVFPGVSVIRCHDLQDHHVTECDHLRVTTPARTIIDLAARLPMGELAICLDEVLSSQRETVDGVAAVLAEVARKGKPGVRVLRSLLEERAGNDYSRSVLEQKGCRILDQGGITGYQSEYPIPWSPRRRFDVAFPEHRVAIEWDSRRWHTHIEAFEVDRERDRAAVVNGWRVLRFTWSDVHDRPTHVLWTVRNVLTDDHRSST